MLTRDQATHQGRNFAEKWDTDKPTVTAEGIKTFAQELNSLNTLNAPQKNALKWAELRGATDGLIDKKVLPNLDVADNKSGLRNCRVVGLTADGDKNDLVVAIGRKKDNDSKAENVVILGHDGKFYQARQVKGGYVKTDEVIAQNAAELEHKYNRPGFAAKTENEKIREKPSRQGQPASDANKRGSNQEDLNIFIGNLESFQKQRPTNDQKAHQELDRLAQEYARLSRDQRLELTREMPARNANKFSDVWVCGVMPSKPQIAIDERNGTVRISALWSDGMTLTHRPRIHEVTSLKFDLETR